MDAPTIPAEIKKAIAEIAKNDAKTDERLVALEEAQASGDGTADIKAQVNELVNERAKLGDDLTKRFDEWEMKQQERGALSGSVVDHAGNFIKAVKDAGVTSDLRGNKSIATTPDLLLGKAITDVGASSGPLLTPDYRDRIIAPGEQMLTLASLLPMGTTSDSVVTWFRELAFTGEPSEQINQGDRKAEVDITFEAVTEPVHTIAEFIKASKQILSDLPRLRSYVENRMRYKLDYKLEGRVLNGSGANQISGINPQAEAFDVALMTGVQGKQKMDVLRQVKTQVGRSFLPCTAVILNPEDVADIELLKDADNSYLWANPTSANGFRPWGLNAVETYQQAAGTFTGGNFTPAALQLTMREAANILISTENEDDFVNNMCTILAELRALLEVYRPDAFVTGTFAAALV